jgi:hypothetical protein
MNPFVNTLEYQRRFGDQIYFPSTILGETKDFAEQDPKRDRVSHLTTLQSKKGLMSMG